MILGLDEQICPSLQCFADLHCLVKEAFCERLLQMLRELGFGLEEISETPYSGPKGGL